MLLFLHLPEGDGAAQVVLLVTEAYLLSSLRAEGPQKHTRVDFLIEGGVDSITIAELINLITFVHQLHRIETCMCTEIVTTVVTVLALRTHTEEVTDWRVVTDLFAIDLSTIGVAALQGLANNRVELIHVLFTGLRNIVM